MRDSVRHDFKIR